MLRSIIIALALVIAVPQFAPPAEAQTQKKSQTQKKKAEKKPVKKKAGAPGKGRSGYSAEERKRMMETARKICRDQFGASSTVYSMDYKALRVRCWLPGS